MGTYIAFLLLGGLVALFSIMGLKELGLQLSEGASMGLIAASTLYSAELFKFLERRIGRYPRP